MSLYNEHIRTPEGGAKGKTHRDPHRDFQLSEMRFSVHFTFPYLAGTNSEISAMCKAHILPGKVDSGFERHPTPSAFLHPKL